MKGKESQEVRHMRKLLAVLEAAYTRALIIAQDKKAEYNMAAKEVRAISKRVRQIQRTLAAADMTAKYEREMGDAEVSPTLSEAS